MAEFVALHAGPPRLKAGLHPADYREIDGPPDHARPGGWNIWIAEDIQPAATVPIRETWEPTLSDAIGHIIDHWPCRPVWRDVATQEIVDLASFEVGDDWLAKGGRSEGD
jgi:hypothetical protein